ncbi:unnamed protein product, partial [Haemonchus placei]|uniref:Ovule protein n=1 Tax=Haemonchus placei TaxID=6290 RepID=A0A0N4X6H2_HAEPC
TDLTSGWPYGVKPRITSQFEQEPATTGCFALIALKLQETEMFMCSHCFYLVYKKSFKINYPVLYRNFSDVCPLLIF